MSIKRNIKNGAIILSYRLRGWRKIDESGPALLFERGDRIVMKTNISTIYSIIDKKSVYTHSYYDYFLPLAFIKENPRILLIGLGAGTIPVQLNRLLSGKMQLEGIDNSHEIVEMAKRNFLNGIKMDIVIEDGAAYTSRQKDRYDLIILDAFIGASIPDQFLDDKFIKDASAALKEDGILAINTVPETLKMLDYINKLGTFFKTKKITPSIYYSNTLVVCSKKMLWKDIVEKVRANMPANDDNRFLFAAYEGL